ncbi:MAG TPA: hypothetical protein VE861_09200 [Gemmatimonadaceae bacterium]|nr:hypothetical protein [Gemmatimonadaceae bacterium]
MTPPPASSIGLGVAAVMSSAVYAWWRHGKARAIAESWLRTHGYKVVTLQAPWFSFVRFPQRWFRDGDSATRFRAVVDDQKLGGTGVLWLRVWTTLAGQASHDVEISWEDLPANADPGFVPAESRLELHQRALLKRIANGETSFLASRRARAGEPPFDELVEHLLAMQVRQLITCSVPLRSRTPGTMYEYVEHAELTDAGRAYLAAIG